MAPDVKRIAQEYVEKQLANIKGEPPSRKAIVAAIKKVAAVIEELRTATTQSRKRSAA